MKRVIFNSIFCLLIITALVLVATPTAIAQITVTGAAASSTSIVATLTYTEAPDPIPTIDDLVLDPSTDVTFDEGTDNDPQTYFITWTNLVQVPNVGVDVSFTLAGYNEVVLSLLTFFGQNIFNILSGLSEGTSGRLVIDPNYVPPVMFESGSYLIVAANSDPIDNEGFFPTLPTIAEPNAIIKVAWSDVSDEPMPDLYALFQDGGTLNLRVNVSGTTDRLGSELTDGTYDDNQERNQRQAVINEVMWGYDDRYLGGVEETLEQWIELYNNGTTTIDLADIKLSTSKSFPGPPAETDRLSNNSSFTNIWFIDSKGQHGNSGSPRREFKSMQRIQVDGNYGDGNVAENWEIATRLYLRNFRGTPGEQNRAATLPTPRKKPNQDNPAKNTIVINEIGNFTDDSLDWIELLNMTNSDQDLAEWVISITTGFGDEEEIIRFEDDSDFYIPARSVLLLVNADPIETPLVAGFDITLDADDQIRGSGPHEYLLVEDNKLTIPNDDKWLLILRNGKPWDVGVDDDDNVLDVYQTGFKVQDVAGPGALHEDFEVLTLNEVTPDYEKKNDGSAEGQIWDTKVFPLNGNTQADSDFLQDGILDTAGNVWTRDSSIQGYLKDAWKKADFTGIGYDRRVSVSDEYGGTPGYDNDVAKERISQLDGGRLIISELMLTSTNKGYPQWIELYNTSRTRAIDLAADSSKPETGWQLIIENHNSGSWKENIRELNLTINLKDLFESYIPPNQTVLIVSATGRFSDAEYYSDSRVAGIYESDYRNRSGMTNKKDSFLNAEGGFYISIVDSDGSISDEVGNLDGQEADLRQGIELDDPFSWNWSTALTEDGHRTSLIRLMDENRRPRVGVPDRSVEGSMRGAVLPMGMNTRPEGYAWVHAIDTAFHRVPDIWYGNGNDVSTPGFIKGTPLPVSLSFFRPTLENGDVVIRWTTESEIDNAGFNILRSQNRSDGFRQINTELILGAGTSGERNTYKWVDTSAKPGVVYYYQIEDVSFAGESQVLTTTRLKGFVSATNKLTTTWSELKSSQ